MFDTTASRLRSVFLVLIALACASIAAAGAQDDADEPPENRLKWSTASEVDNFGYDVFRGDAEEGPFEKLTEDPIPGAGTTDEPSYYEFVDTEIDPTRDYYYYVESIALDGTREKFTPIIRAKAKQPPEGEGDAGADGSSGR